MVKSFQRLALSVLLCSAGLSAAQGGASPSNRQEPCWKQAGISQSVMEQRHSVERDAHSQVESVCQNSSLTPQQKQEQVREIRQQVQQKLDALITSEQQSTLHACQQQRGANGSSHERQTRRGAGPCGNMGSPQGRQGPSGGNPQQPENSQQ